MTIDAAHDYYAIYNRKTAKSSGSFYCNVFARDRTHALKIARNNGFRPTRHAYAIHIGRTGYFASLRRAFKV